MVWSPIPARLCVAVLLAGFVGCSSDSASNPSEPSSVSIAPLTTTVGVGATQALVAVLKDQNGNPISGAQFSWSSSNPSVAAVDGGGVVTGEALGSASITATFDTLTAHASVQVVAGPPGSLHLAFSTYLGGSQEDQVRDVAEDAQGNIYIAGGTRSPDFPTTAGAYDRTHNGNYDVFVAKLSPQGQILWSTLLGGPNYDRAYSIEVDAQGFVYIAGRAGEGFPVTAGAFQTTFGGGTSDPTYDNQDGFVCKLTPDGSARVFCSYFGTSDNQIIRDMAIDGQGAMYLGSSHVSGAYPGPWFTHGAQPSPAGGMDGVIAKISPDGSQVDWATYVGGSGDEEGTPSVRVGPSGAVYALYATNSADAPTPNGFDHSMGGPRDAYVVKISPDGGTLLFGTFLGGSSSEGVETHELALDSQENPVVMSQTQSTDFPVTAGAYQTTYGGTGGPGQGIGTNYQGDIYVAKIANNGGSIITATYLGGASGEGGEGVALDAQDNVYLSGGSYTPRLSFMTSGFQSAGKGTVDLLAIELSADFKTVLYGSYLGGAADDMGRSAMVTPDGNFLVVGMSQSTNFSVLNALQPGSGGGLDGIVAKFTPGP